MLGLIIGGRHVGFEQEVKPCVTIVMQVPSKGVVGRVGTRALREAAEAIAVFLVGGRPIGRSDFRLPVGVA